MVVIKNTRNTINRLTKVIDHHDNFLSLFYDYLIRFACDATYKPVFNAIRVYLNFIFDLRCASSEKY